MRGVRAMVAGGVLVGLLLPGPAGAEPCAPTTALSRHTVADVVFDGIATDARLPSDAVRHTAVTFAVRTWHKAPAGDTPLTLTVRLPESEFASVRAGETWRVYASQVEHGVLRSERCGGTHRLASLSEPVLPGPGYGLTGALAVATVGLGARRRFRRPL